MSEEKKTDSNNDLGSNVDVEDQDLDELEDSLESKKEVDEKKDSEKQNLEVEIDWKDKYVRLHADWENYRKRMDEQRSDERIRATENLMRELLPLIDDMKHALDYAEDSKDSKLVEGFSAISAKFMSALEKHGLQEIDPKGQPFDPIMHQAVSTVEDSSIFEETVKDVYQKGYKLGIKVLRPAMVTITTGGEKRPKQEDKQDGKRDDANAENKDEQKDKSNEEE